MALSNENTAQQLHTQTADYADDYDITRKSIDGLYVNSQNEVISGTIIAALLTLAGLAGYSLLV